jgi:hypothetical protein
VKRSSGGDGLAASVVVEDVTVKADMWEEIDEAREPVFDYAYEGLKGYFAAILSHAEAALEGAGTVGGALAEVRGDVDMLRGVYADIIRTAARPMAEAVFEAFVPKARTHADFSDDAWDMAVREYIDTVAARRIVGVDASVMEWVRGVLEAGLAEELTVFEVGQRLREQFPDFTAVRAERIARTETVAASNYGALAGARMVGRRYGLVLRKRWLSARDRRTRRNPPDDYDHVEADGQERALDEPFLVSGELLDHPGDPSGSAGNVINCRCAVIIEAA